MTTDNPATIEFPCPDYPIKVLGQAVENFEAEVLKIVSRHAELSQPPEPPKNSREGRFLSLTLAIVATGESQLRALNDELLALDFVKMVM